MNTNEITNNIDESKLLNEVRDWKKQVYLDTIGMDEMELIEYFKSAPERAS
jgi:hypothetical protein